MKHLRITWAVLFCALTTFSAPAGADIIFSQSNDPSVQLEHRLNGLLGPDSAQLEPRRGNLLSRLLVPASRRMPMGALPDYSTSALARLPKAKGGPEWACLAEALYFEARGESVRGIFAVAEVILNRVDSRAFPGSVCKVVNQGTGRRNQCQFTFTCNGNSRKVHERKAWVKVGKIARLMLDGGQRKLTHGATFYHTNAVRPRWSRTFDKTASIGVHLFYRNG